MKTYLSDLIPKIKRFSQKLDNVTLLTNQHWVVIDELKNSKYVYIFRSNSDLLISQDGKVEKGRWEYLGNNAILIERNEGSYLFRHGFFDENVLALKVDGKEEYAFLVNESKFESELNSFVNVIEFLNRKYVDYQIIQSIDEKIGSVLNDNNIQREMHYLAPEYKQIKILEKLTLTEGTVEVFNIVFDDGEVGEVCMKKKNNEAYFKEKPADMWVNFKYLYCDLDYCIRALHYFKKNKQGLNEGLIAIY